MNIEEIREYCIAKKGVTESFPFNETALVFKVLEKMFALLDISVESKGISLKCDPELAVKLREDYEGVTPGYHFNKKHWNTVELDGSVPENKVHDWIDHSYDIVITKLTKAEKAKLDAL